MCKKLFATLLGCFMIAFFSTSPDLIKPKMRIRK